MTKTGGGGHIGGGGVAQLIFQSSEGDGIQTTGRVPEDLFAGIMQGKQKFESEPKN